MNLAILINLNAALLFLAVACFIVVRRPPAPLGPTLFTTQLMALLWIAGEIGTQLATELAAETLAIDAVYAGSYGLVATWWVLAFRFAERHGVQPEWATAPVVWGPSVFAFATFLVVATNPYHGQFLTPVIGGRNEYHWMWWAGALSAYGLVLVIAAGYFHLYRRFENAPHARRQSAMMLLAMLPVLVANATYTLAPIDWPFDVSVLGGLVTGVVFVFGCYDGTLYDLSAAVMRDLWNRDTTGLLVVDSNGRLLYANLQARSLFESAGLDDGAPAESGIRATLRPIEADADPISLTRIWRESQDGEDFGVFCRPINSDEHTRLWLTAHPIARPGERAEALIIRIHDMTHIHRLEADRRAIEARLTQSDRLRSLGVLSAGIAHEVNNPVGSALLAAEFGAQQLKSARDRDDAISIAEEALGTVIDQSQRAARVTRAMLRFAREGGGEHQVGDLRDVISEAQQFTNELARQHGAYVDIELCDEAPLVRFNPTEMEQVLVNLIHNAIVSGKRGRHVNVSVEAGSEYARIVVSDDGDGMTQQQIEHAFEPFYSSREGSTGTGLGLSVVHGIVTDCGGEVWLESELGLGTRAVVRLPIA